MTREEASRMLSTIVWPDHDQQRMNAAAERWVDAFSALGIMKLDADQALEARLDREIQYQLNKGGFDGGIGLNATFIAKCCRAANLKIVEAKS